MGQGAGSRISPAERSSIAYRRGLKRMGFGELLSA
jgi:hypothetical protein